MDRERRRALEAILMVTTEPVPSQILAQLLEIPTADVEAAIAELTASCAGRGFHPERVAGGYRFASHPDCAPYVERFVLAREPARLSAAALETLGIVAYRQPVSRAQISEIRGVNVDGVVRTLQRRGLVDAVAVDPGPGNAVLFGTTRLFLERLGLDSLGDLPPLGDFVPDAEVTESLETSLRDGERSGRNPAPDAGPAGGADSADPMPAAGPPGEGAPADPVPGTGSRPEPGPADPAP